MQYKTEYLVFRDYDMAAEYYREFLEGDAGYTVDPYGNTDYLVIFDSHQSAEKTYYQHTKLKAMRHNDLLDLWREYFTEYIGFDAMTKSELIGDLLKITRRQYYANHYEQNGFHNIEEYEFSVAGYSQGDIIKVCNADDISCITPDFIHNLFYDTPIHAKAEVWKREDSDCAWELADEFYLCDYTDIYTPLHEQVYQCLLNENNLLAHLVAYDMPSGIFENVE